MKVKSLKNIYYSTLDMPIRNYIEFRKWAGMASILGYDYNSILRLERMEEIFKNGGDDEKANIITRNIIALKQLIKDGINPFLYAFTCLLKETTMFDDETLKTSQNKLLKDNQDFITFQVENISDKIQNELVIRNFEKGDWVEGRYRTNTERTMFNTLVRRINNSIDYDNLEPEKFYKALSETYQAYDAIEMEKSMPNQMYRTLAILRQKAQIETAFDYYIQLNINNEIQNKSAKTKTEKKIINKPL